MKQLGDTRTLLPSGATTVGLSIIIQYRVTRLFRGYKDGV